jgi:putative addiction module component (TIGR02574 family)
MTVAEKVQLLEAIWDNLCQHTGDVQSPQWHREILEERSRQLAAGKITVSSWEEAKARLSKLWIRKRLG